MAFQFSGGLPAVTADRVPAVYADPRGTPVPLAGQSYLHVVFHGASAVCQQRQQPTWTGPSVLTPAPTKGVSSITPPRSGTPAWDDPHRALLSGMRRAGSRRMIIR